MSKDCGEFEGLIAAQLYGDLAATDLSRLEAHLASCDACRQERESLARTVEALGPVDLETVETQSDAFVKAIHRKLGQKTHRRLPARKIVVRKPGWILPLSVAAATLLAALGILILTWPKPPPVEVA